MWHLKTRSGTFWVLEANDDSAPAEKYVLGIDDEELGVFDDAEQAASQVYQQETGFFKWDCQSRVRAPQTLQEWKEGSPEDWE